MADEYVERREELLESIERDQEELREAVHDLTDAARETFVLAERIRESPVAWLVGGALLGLWLGARASAASQSNGGGPR